MNEIEDSICPLCEKAGSLYKKTKMCEECYKQYRAGLMLKSKIHSESKFEIDQITDNIYLGDYEGAFKKEKLQELGITHILICGYFLEELFPNDFKYMTIEINDDEDEDILMYFEKTNEFINSSSKVYIHCMAGISRSPSIAISFLMWRNSLPFFKAFQIVKQKRNVFPNRSFIKQLHKYQEILNINNGDEELFLKFKKEYIYYYIGDLKDGEEMEFC